MCKQYSNYIKGKSIPFIPYHVLSWFKNPLFYLKSILYPFSNLL